MRVLKVVLGWYCALSEPSVRYRINDLRFRILTVTAEAAGSSPVVPAIDSKQFRFNGHQIVTPLKFGFSGNFRANLCP
jgi:hypothetical protein